MPIGVSKVAFLCFQQLSLNIKQKFESLYRSIDGERPLSVVVGVVGLLVEKPLYSRNATFPVLPNLFKV